MAQVETIDISKHFSKEVFEEICTYVDRQVEYLYTTWQSYLNGDLIEARRLYKGLPSNEYVDFPWENASNLVIQVIGTTVDNLAARIMASIWQVMPLFSVSVVGEWPPHNTEGIEPEKYKNAIEEMLFTFASDPAILDLYRKEQLWFTDGIKYGTKVIKIPYDSCIEANVLSADSVVDTLVYRGPRPENIEPEDFATYPEFDKLEDSPFKYHRVRLTKQQLQERVHTHQYDADIVDSILGQPDDTGSTTQQIDTNNSISLSSVAGTEVAAHYYLYECWFPYFENGRKYRLIVTWSRKARKTLRAIFNFYTDNSEPFEVARLGYRTSEFIGYGFAQMLRDYQEEVSAIHNKRQDNMTVANIQGVRISSRSTKVDANFKLAPGFIFPGEKDEIEPISFGSSYRSTENDEELVLKEVADRSGVSAAVTGLGGGTVSKKGIYSSQGTFAALQAGNTRADLDIMDMRYAHLRLGRKLLRIYTQFGVMNSHLAMFGNNSDIIKQALEHVQNKKLMLAANAATASINRELERQNSILLSTQLTRQQQANSQLVQAITNPQVPPAIKEYLTNCLRANNLMLKRILRSFNFEDPSSYVPEFMDISNAGNTQQQQSIQNTSRPTGGQAQPSQVAANVPGAGMGGVSNVPQ